MSTQLDDLAKKGYSLDKEIERKLESFWDEFTAIQPSHAKHLEEFFDDKAFAALMCVSKYHGKPSIIELLALGDLDQVKERLGIRDVDASILTKMPNVGKEEDFERKQ